MSNKPSQAKARQRKTRQTRRFRKVLLQCKVANARLGAPQGNAGLEATQGKIRQGKAMRGGENARVSRYLEHGRVRNRWIPLAWHPACCNDFYESQASTWLPHANIRPVSGCNARFLYFVVRHELIEQNRTGNRTVTPDNLLFCHVVSAS